MWFTGKTTTVGFSNQCPLHEQEQIVFFSVTSRHLTQGGISACVYCMCRSSLRAPFTVTQQSDEDLHGLRDVGETSKVRSSTCHVSKQKFQLNPVPMISYTDERRYRTYIHSDKRQLRIPISSCHFSIQAEKHSF